MVHYMGRNGAHYGAQWCTLWTAMGTLWTAMVHIMDRNGAHYGPQWWNNQSCRQGPRTS